MTIRLQYPYIQGNPVCDGTVHMVEPTRLSHVIGLPLLVLDYYDRKVGIQCITIILMDNEGFHKIPLLGYNELFELLNNGECLEPVDIGNLPDTIGTNEPVRDWPELIATCSGGSTPQNDPPMLGAAAGGNTPHWPSPFSPDTPCRKVITLYVDGETVKRKGYDETGNEVFYAISYYSLCRLFEEYDIIWRYTDETLVATKSEISIIMEACEYQLSDEYTFYRIKEVDLTNHGYEHAKPENYGRWRWPSPFVNHDKNTLPPYYGDHIHRYEVTITRR